MQEVDVINNEDVKYKHTIKLMGNIFEFSIRANGQQFADVCFRDAVAEVKRIEKLLTTFNDSSQTNLINKNAGIKPVEVDEEVFSLIQRSIYISEITQGAFDISYGSLDKRFWNFDLTMSELPDKKKAMESVRLINYKNILLDKDSRTVYLKNKGMRIGFGGIGKGYAAERAKQMLKAKGIISGIVNASGDLTTWGTQQDGAPYTIGIANPSASEYPFAVLNISDKAIATSGNYEKYVWIGGKKYSHTIDPKTGYPVTGIKSVTIICEHAELADALATPVMVMGRSAGLYMINQMKNIGCIIVDDNDLIYYSDTIKVR